MEGGGSSGGRGVKWREGDQVEGGESSGGRGVKWREGSQGGLGGQHELSRANL